MTQYFRNLMDCRLHSTFPTMKKSLPLLIASLVCALFVTGCETDGLSARKQEKSAVYATLKPWEKSYIDKGVIALGFTPDMVYMAVGNASKVEPVVNADGTKAEMWTFKNYYPSVEANALKYNYNTESHYQPSATQSNGAGGQQPLGTSRNGGPSIGTTGGPQGTMDLAELPSYTLWVTFRDGKVVKMKLDPN